jgi:hypothetical protein
MIFGVQAEIQTGPSRIKVQSITRPVGGRSAKWTQLDSTPHYIN